MTKWVIIYKILVFNEFINKNQFKIVSELKLFKYVEKINKYYLSLFRIENWNFILLLRVSLWLVVGFYLIGIICYFIWFRLLLNLWVCLYLHRLLLFWLHLPSFHICVHFPLQVLFVAKQHHYWSYYYTSYHQHNSNDENLIVRQNAVCWVWQFVALRAGRITSCVYNNFATIWS